LQHARDVRKILINLVEDANLVDGLLPDEHDDFVPKVCGQIIQQYLLVEWGFLVYAAPKKLIGVSMVVVCVIVF